MIYLLGKDPAISSEKKQALLDIFNEKICLEELFQATHINRNTFDTARP
jgi:hypothetical protein